MRLRSGVGREVLAAGRVARGRGSRLDELHDVIALLLGLIFDFHRDRHAIVLAGVSALCICRVKLGEVNRRRDVHRELIGTSTTGLTRALKFEPK